MIELSRSYNRKALWRIVPVLFLVSPSRVVGIRVGRTRSPMIDSDALTLIALLLVVVAALLIPPGPGTPLRSPVTSR